MKKEIETIMTQNVNGKDVTYVSIQKGKHVNKVLQVYYVRPKDGVLVGKDLESGAMLSIGKGSISEKARTHFGIKMGKVKKDYSNILDVMKTESKKTLTRNSKGQFVKA